MIIYTTFSKKAYWGEKYLTDTVKLEPHCLETFILKEKVECKFSVIVGFIYHCLQGFPLRYDYKATAL